MKYDYRHNGILCDLRMEVVIHPNAENQTVSWGFSGFLGVCLARRFMRRAR